VLPSNHSSVQGQVPLFGSDKEPARRQAIDLTTDRRVAMEELMYRVTCRFGTVGCSQTLPCSKCRGDASRRANRATRPRFHARSAGTEPRR
jgi:hypothetical protein